MLNRLGYYPCVGSSGIIYIDPTSLRRTATLPAVAAATNLPTNQDNHPVTMTTTVNQLARAFGVVVRQIADLLMMLQDYHALVPNLTRVLDISATEVLELQVTDFHPLNTILCYCVLHFWVFLSLRGESGLADCFLDFDMLQACVFSCKTQKLRAGRFIVSLLSRS